MAAPEYVPSHPGRRSRQDLPLPPPARPRAPRPGEVTGEQPKGRGFGSQGPDQGYALLLARQFVDRLVLRPGEHAEDVLAGATSMALRRASLLGRAPLVHDFEVGLGIWGFLGPADDELVASRRPLFAGAAHHGWDDGPLHEAISNSGLTTRP